MTDGSRFDWPRIRGTVVHLGAGAAPDTESYLAAGAQRVVVVEADPVAARLTRHRYQAHPAVEVIAAAIGERAGDATLHEYNVPGLVTISTVEARSVRWPSLREVRRTQVNAYTLGELLEHLELRSGDHWLVNDVLGQEQLLLRSLEHSQSVAQLFARVFLFTVAGGWELPEQDPPVLSRLLERAGYRLDNVEARGSRVRLDAGPSTLWTVVQSKRAECDDAEKRAQLAAKELSQAKSIQTQLESCRSELQKKLAESNERAAAVSARLEARVAELRDAHATLQKSNTALRLENKHLGERIRTLDVEIGRADEQLEFFKQEFIRSGGLTCSKGEDQGDK